MIDIEAVLKEEKELEEKLFGTPEVDPTNDTEATSDEQETEETPAEEEEKVTPNPKPVTDEPVESTREPDADEWKRRYTNLRNSRDTRTHEAKRQLTAALETIQVLQQTNEELREELVKARAVQDPLANVFTEEEAEALGDDTVNIMKKGIAKATESATADLRKQLDEQKIKQKAEVESQLRKAREEEYDAFIARVAAVVPDWNDLNTDKGFADYCHSTYDIDGSLVADNFRAAEKNRDATSIIRYMMNYKSRPVEKPKVNPLEEQVVPKGQPSGPVNTEEKVEYITRTEINKFYDDLSRGIYRGREREALEKEATIDKAVMEGRVR